MAPSLNTGNHIMDSRQTFRALTECETAQLEQQGNRADDWSGVRICDGTDLGAIWHNRFGSGVDIARVARLADSRVEQCSIGDGTVVDSVHLLRGYDIGAGCRIDGVGRMTFGGAPLEVMNENGGRAIAAMPGMTVGDAYLWARYRGRKALMQRLEQWASAGRRGSVGDGTVIENAIAVEDGVMGPACSIGHGVIAVRFLLGEHVHLEYGLRLNDTVVGDNSTLARCEVGNSMVFPAHEQHHNNSFLIAALVMGQSNVAAGCTIGSNHNSRTADNELAAGRGFWPGLCCSFKHSSRFASYCLLAKGDYPAELDIRLPFALVNNNVGQDRLEVMPAYWWMYNMYALDRNGRKFAARDKRTVSTQHIEFDPLAPDTAEEILHAMALLRRWMAEARDGVVLAEGMEKGKRPVVILKAREGLQAYEDMLVYYAMKTLPPTFSHRVADEGLREWVNIGGQLVTRADIERLIADVEQGTIDGWDALHGRMDALWEAYPAQREAHAYGVLCRLSGVDRLDEALWQHYRGRYAAVQQYIEAQKKASREKDDINPFRRMTYWDDAEREAVIS